MLDDGVVLNETIDLQAARIRDLEATVARLRELVADWRNVRERAKEGLDLDLLDEEEAIFGICADELESALSEERE